MKKAIFLTLIFNMLTSISLAGSTQPLFIVERSKNTNVLHYDAQLSDSGKLLDKMPLIVYWVLLAEDGRRQELSWLERTMAFGFDVKKDSSGEGYRVILVAYKEREVKIYKQGDSVRAEIIIDGRPSYFDRVYINSRDGFLLLEVDYIELYGRDIITGEKRYERISAKQ